MEQDYMDQAARGPSILTAQIFTGSYRSDFHRQRPGASSIGASCSLPSLRRLRTASTMHSRGAHAPFAQALPIDAYLYRS